jgi:glyoxylase-like metal-dependent hydrolase (beta-lactamase superfamily II)
MTVTRRAGLGLLLGASLAPMTALAQTAAPPFNLIDLGHGVFAGVDIEGRAGSNAGFVIGDDGVLVVDSFFNPAASKALLEEIRKRTRLPIRYVVNTHYHLDHTMGNATFHDAGATVVAQRHVADWVHSENPKFFGDKITPEQKAAIAAIPAPTLLVDKRTTLRLGRRVIEVVERPGHTGGDVTVYIPDARVLFCGDLLWKQIPPNLIDATVSKWIPTLEAVERAPHASALTYVPGHGDIAKLADVAEFRGYLEAVRAAVKAGQARDLRGDELVKTASATLVARYPAWPRIERAAPREVGFMIQELDGTKRWPQPQDAR